MSELIAADLERELLQYLGPDLPEGVSANVGAALQVADALEARGFEFTLRDMCPKSLDDSRWRAVFSRDGLDCAVEDAEPALAVCAAAVDALRSSQNAEGS